MCVCARVSVLKCWVCLAPVRTLPRRPAWCPWPPGSADPALESRWALLLFPQFLGKGFKVLKLKLGSKTQMEGSGNTLLAPQWLQYAGAQGPLGLLGRRTASTLV